MLNRSGIYQILNTVNGKCYIGSSVHIRRRFGEHKTHLRSARHHSVSLQRAFDKYGKDAFSFHVLLICEESALLFYEQRAIDVFNPEYNICRVAGNTLGKKNSEAARKKIAAALTGRKQSPEHIAASVAGRIGLRVSDETRAKISKAHIGMSPSAETREKLSALNTGKTMPNDVRSKISAALAGKRKSAEAVLNMTKAQQRPEVRLKRSKSLTGITRSPETRAKMSAARRATVERKRMEAANG